MPQDKDILADRVLRKHYPIRVPKQSPKRTVSPTRVVDPCLRRAVLKQLGFQEPIDQRGEANMSFGSMRHERVQSILLSYGYLVKNPEPVAGRSEAEYLVSCEDPPIMGYADGITYRGRIFEFKTANEEKIPAPKKEHVDQITLYMHLLEREEGEILYELKLATGRVGSGIWRSFVIPYDEERARSLMQRARTIYEMAQKKKLPQISCRRCYMPTCTDIPTLRKEGLLG